MLDVVARALVRGLSVLNYAEGGNSSQQINSRGDLMTAQALPERTELVRMGNSYGTQIKDASAFTALITIPTTQADLALQNGEAAGGKSYIIDRVWVKCKTSLAAANYLAILAQLVAPGTALVADSANKLVYSLSGKPNYGGKAQIAVSSVVTGAVADKWFPLGGMSLPTSTTIAAVYEVFCYGRYIIPPGGNFSLTAQEAVSGGTLLLGLDWHEVQLPLA